METRQAFQRVNHQNTNRYKRAMSVVMLGIVTLVFCTLTFMNPFYMKSYVRRGNASVAVERVINRRFNNFAQIIGASSAGDTNMLTTKQTDPLAGAIIDYKLGIHWFKADSTALAQNIANILETKIDDDDSTEAKAVKSALHKRQANAIYAIEAGFGLSNTIMAANFETLFMVINILFIILGILMVISLWDEARALSPRERVHETMAAGMWAGFWLMVIFVALAALPLLFPLSDANPLGFFFEMASGAFLELVMVGAIIYVVCAIPWQFTSAN
jgi:hypothetical protein